MDPGRRSESSPRFPTPTDRGKLAVTRALPTEYLRRLELQNQLFGNDIRVAALTRGNRFVITQPTLRGGEPTEIEIREVLEGAGWKRVPMKLQDLPIQLRRSSRDSGFDPPNDSLTLPV